MKTCDIDKLRAMVRYFSNCNESFNQQFTISELERLYDVAQCCALDCLPDRWTVEQLSDALASEKVPTWDD
mgnify:CR=1 FL=1